MGCFPSTPDASNETSQTQEEVSAPSLPKPGLRHKEEESSERKSYLIGETSTDPKYLEENSKCGPPPGSDKNSNTIYGDENRNTLFVDLKKSVKKNQFSDVLHKGEQQKPNSENRKIDANIDRGNWRPKGRTARKYAAASLIIENVLRARKFRDCRTLSDSSSPTKMDDSTVQSATNLGENATPTPAVRNETPLKELQTQSTPSQEQSYVEKEPEYPETVTPPKTPAGGGGAESDDRSEDDASTQSEEHSHPNQTPSPISLKPTRGPDEVPPTSLTKASKAVVDAVVQAVVRTTSKIDLDAKPPAELISQLAEGTSTSTPTTTATPERAQERALSTPAVKMPSKSIADLIDCVLTDDEDSSDLFDHGNNQGKNETQNSPNHAGTTGEFNKGETEDFGWDADSEDDRDGAPAQPPQNELEMMLMIRKKIEQLKKALSDPAPTSPLDESTEGSDHHENDHDADHGDLNVDLDAASFNSPDGKLEVNAHSETTTESAKDQSSGEVAEPLLENSVEQLEANHQHMDEQIKERSDAEQLEDNRHNTDDETDEVEQLQNERHEAEQLKEEGYEAEQLDDGVKVEGDNVRENAQLTEEGHDAEQLEDEVHDTEEPTEEENQAEQLNDGGHDAEHLEDELHDSEQVNDAGHKAEQLQLEEPQHLKDENSEVEQTEVEGREVEQLRHKGHDIDKPKEEIHEADDMKDEKDEPEQFCDQENEPEQPEVEAHEAEQLEEDRHEADQLEDDRQDAELSGDDGQEIERSGDDVQESRDSTDEEHQAEYSGDEEHETDQETDLLIEFLTDESQQDGQLVDEGLEAEQLEGDSDQTAVVKIQCAFRIHRDRKKAAQIRKNNELERLKNAEAEQARIDRENAAIKFQSCLRMYRGRQQVKELRAIYEAEKMKAEREAAAVKIQSAFRVHKLMRTASHWEARTEEPDVVQQVVRQLFLTPDPASTSIDTDLNSLYDTEKAGDVDDMEEETQTSPKLRHWLKRRQKRQLENSSSSSGQISSGDSHTQALDVVTGVASSPTDNQTKSGHESDSPQMMQRKVTLKEREQADHVSSASTQEQISSSEAGDNRIVVETEPQSTKPAVPVLNLTSIPACATDSYKSLYVDTVVHVDTGSESDTLTSEDLADATAAAMAAMTAHLSPKGVTPHDAQPSLSTPDLEADCVPAGVPAEHSAAARLQALVRCRLARRNFVQKRKAASWLQCVVRGWRAWRVRRAVMSGRYEYNPLDCSIRRLEHAGRTPRSALRSHIVRTVLSPSGEKTPRSEKKKFPILASVHTKYEVVKKVIAKNGFITTKQKTLWGFQWTDVEKWIHTGLKGYQCRNVVPGVSQITNKCNLSRKMNVMQKFAADHFTFYPKSWCLPKDRYRLEAELRRRMNHGATFIAKPDTTCQGKGITLMQGNPKGMITNVDWKVMPCVVQKYISNPLLIHGFKFDMRIYVLLIAPTATSRKKIFLHKDGLVRMCTQAYEPPNASNLDNVKMHLSNYAINKEKPPPAQRKPPITPSNRVRRSNTIPRRGGYTPSSRARASARLERRRKLAQAHRKAAAAATCKKRPPFVKTSVRWLGQWLEKTRGRGTMMRMWCGIADCVTKTILSSTHVFAAYRKRSCAPDTKCFHILGFDIMLDADLQPHLLEVNTSPSFNGDAGVDTRVKTAVLMQAFKLAKVVPLARRHCKMHQEEVEEEVAICEESEMQESIAHLSTAGKLLARLRGVRRRRDSRAALDSEQATESKSKDAAVAKATAKVSPPRKSNSRRGSDAAATTPTNKVHSNVSKEAPKTIKRRIPLSKISPAPSPPGSPSSSGLYVSVTIGSPTSRRLSRTAPSPKAEFKNTLRSKTERINGSVTPRRTPRVRNSPRVTRHGISTPIENRRNKVDPRLVFDWDRMNATGSEGYWRLYPAQIPETQKVFDYIERLASENIKLPYDA